MITIKSISPGVLTIETPESLKTTRINQGNQMMVLTSDGVLVRVLNDLDGPVTFSPVQIGNASINAAANELTIPSIPDFLYVSQLGEKVNIQ